jgi:hypothetical protein
VTIYWHWSDHSLLYIKNGGSYNAGVLVSLSYQELGLDGVVDVEVCTLELLVDNAAAVPLFTWSDLFSKRRSASSLQAIHLTWDA